MLFQHSLNNQSCCSGTAQSINEKCCWSGHLYLLDDLQRLSHLQHPHNVSVVGVAVGADRDAKIEHLVAVVRRHLAYVPLDAGTLSITPEQPQLMASSDDSIPMSLVL